jgi:two-component system NtrC family response regulator
MKGKILIIDDDENLLKALGFMLEENRYTVLTARSGEEGIKILKQEGADVVITDLQMPQMGGMEVLKTVLGINRDIPVILLTAYGTVESAVEAMKLGAFDYVTKPVSREELVVNVEKALGFNNLVDENRNLRREVAERYKFENIVGDSPKVKELFSLMERVADADSNVLILGETGTGKELIARAIHYNSRRSGGPFVTVNCAAIPEPLVESELFGYAKGAFTGADRDKKGKFEVANRGTIFLDEITEMKPHIQAKLLRVIQEREVDRVGDTKPVKIDARIIAASNADVEKAVKGGVLREDLYYRLNVVSINVPPLRERKQDIPLLTSYFVERYGTRPKKVGDDVMKLLMAYQWPGNVRELQNAIEHILIVGRGESISPEDLPQRIRDSARTIEDVVIPLPEKPFSLDKFEKILIIRALERFKWNQTKTAQYLGITRQTLIYRMDKYNIRGRPAENM